MFYRVFIEGITVDVVMIFPFFFYLYCTADIMVPRTDITHLVHNHIQVRQYTHTLIGNWCVKGFVVCL